MTSADQGNPAHFKVRKLSPTPSDTAPSPIADDLRVITHDPDNGEDENLDSFIPPLDLPLHSRDVMPRYPDVLKMAYDFDDVKRDLHKIYGVYEDNRPPTYGPHSDRPHSSVYSDKPINEIVDKYIGVVTYGTDKSFLDHDHVNNRLCPTCNSVVPRATVVPIHPRSPRKSHPPPLDIPNHRRLYSPVHIPNLPPSPVISAELMPHVPSFEFPEVSQPIGIDPARLARFQAGAARPTKNVHFDDDVHVQMFTPEPRDTPPRSRSNPVDDAERRRLAERQRLLLLAAIEAEKDKKDDTEDEIAAAGFKFDDAMDKLGAKVKAFEEKGE